MHIQKFLSKTLFLLVVGAAGAKAEIVQAQDQHANELYSICYAAMTDPRASKSLTQPPEDTCRNISETCTRARYGDRCRALKKLLATFDEILVGKGLKPLDLPKEDEVRRLANLEFEAHALTGVEIVEVRPTFQSSRAAAFSLTIAMKDAPAPVTMEMDLAAIGEPVWECVTMHYPNVLRKKISAAQQEELKPVAPSEADKIALKTLRILAVSEEAYFVNNETYVSCKGGRCEELLPGFNQPAGVEIEIVAHGDRFVGQSRHVSGSGEIFRWDNMAGGLVEDKQF